MCVRYYRRSDKQNIAEAFSLGKLPDNFVLTKWDFNVAPSTLQPVIRQKKETGEREMVLMSWGLVPQFTKNLNQFRSFTTINARAETILSKDIWRLPFQRQRCLIPADGFYEWAIYSGDTPATGIEAVPLTINDGTPAPPAARGRKIRNTVASQKVPYSFSLAEGKPFVFAGLWDAWKDAHTGRWVESFSIITTEANELIAPIHNRMPVILAPPDFDRWLDRNSDPYRPPIDLLRPYPSDKMQAHEANRDVGKISNNHPGLLNVVVR